MVNFSLMKDLGMGEDQALQAVEQEFKDQYDPNQVGALLDSTGQSFANGTILKGKIVNIHGDDVVVEIGLKSEGVLSLSREWDPEQIPDVEVGDDIKVLLEQVESDNGLVVISKRKADRMIGWQEIIEKKKEGDPVSGKVTRKIKGGLLVDIGVPVFLPASQVDIRRPGEISDWIGRSIDAVILKIDEERRNIVISRRKMIEQQREEMKKKTLDSLAVGTIIKGTVKNIADFGAFIDLGGIDGLLHITDMSRGRINHPSEMLKIDSEVAV